MKQIANNRCKYLIVLEARIWMVTCLAPDQDANRDMPLPGV